MNKIFLLLVMISSFSIKAQSNTWCTQPGCDTTHSNTLSTTLSCAASECIHCGDCENVFLVSEKTALNRLFWNDQNNPSYFKVDSFPLDYYITILTNHIQKLENKIASRITWWQSSGLYKALGLAGFTSLMGTSFIVNHNWGANPDYIGLTFQTAMIGACVAVTLQHVQKLYRYNERLIERLNRDKRILAILEEEKKARQAHVLQNVAQVLGGAVGKAIHSIGNAIHNVMKSDR